MSSFRESSLRPQNLEIPRPSSCPPVERPGPFPFQRSEVAYSPSLDGFPRDNTGASFVDPIQGSIQTEIRNRHHRIQSDEVELISPGSGSTLLPYANDPQRKLRVAPADSGLFSTIHRFFSRWKNHPADNVRQIQRDIDSGTKYKIRLEILEKDFQKGIPQLSKLLDQNDSFCQHRRFGHLASRILVEKEKELDDLDQKIKELDERDAASPNTQQRLRGISLDGDDAQKEQLDKAEKKLESYWNLFLKYVEIRSLESVSDLNYNSVMNWVKKNEPLVNDEYLHLRDDFVSAKKSTRDKFSTNKLGIKFQQFLARNHNSQLNRLFLDKAKSKTTNNPGIVHGSDDSVFMVAKLELGILTTAVILIPVLLIFLLDIGPGFRSIIVVLSVLACLAVLVGAVDLSEQEIFLGIAGYTAILVAILGSTMNGRAGA